MKRKKLNACISPALNVMAQVKRKLTGLYAYIILAVLVVNARRGSEGQVMSDKKLEWKDVCECEAITSLNDYHAGELMTLCHVVTCMLAEHLEQHPLVCAHPELKKLLDDASEKIMDVYQAAGQLSCEYDLVHSKESEENE